MKIVSPYTTAHTLSMDDSAIQDKINSPLWLDQFPVPVVARDSENRVVFWNRAAQSLFGWSAAEMYGTVLPLVADTNLAGAEAKSAKQNYHLLPAKGGGTVETIVHDGPVVDDAGRLLGRIAVIEEIGERTRREEGRLNAIKAQRDILVREVHHRIKNHLQGVAGLLRQQLGERPMLKPLLDATISQVLSIATVHGLQGDQQSANVDVSGLIERIASTVSALTLSLIATQFERAALKDIMLIEDEAVPVALIVNELLINAAKHAASHASRTVAIAARREHEVRC